MMSMSYRRASCRSRRHQTDSSVGRDAAEAPHLIHFLLPVGCHGGPGGVPPVGDGVEDPGCVDLRRVPVGQNVSERGGNQAVLVAGHVDEVAAERLQLQRDGRRLRTPA